MTKRLLIFSFYLCLGISANGDSPKAAEERLGDSVNGLACGLRAERDVLYLGETVQLVAVLKYLGEQPIQIPYESTKLATFSVHLITPGGLEYEIAHANPNSKDERYLKLGKGHAITLLTVSAADPRLWKPTDTSNKEPFSLRKKGEYRILVEYQPAEFSNAPENAWTGKLRSNEIRLIVREMPFEKRTKEATVEQAADLKKYLENPSDQQTKDRLRKALQLTENEGLALDVLKLLRGKKFAEDKQAGVGIRDNLIWMVTERVGYEELRIDGPSLKELAEFLLPHLEKELATTKNRSAGATAGALLVYLSAHPEDKELREKTTALAKKYAKISDPIYTAPREKSDYRDHWVAHARLHFGWGALKHLGILKENMSLKDAVSVLGEPTDRREGWVSWCYNSPMHINPYVAGQIEGENLVKLTIGSR